MENYHAQIFKYNEPPCKPLLLDQGKRCPVKKEICLPALILTHLLLYMRQINPLNNFCPGNFVFATLTIPRSVSRWFSWIIPSCLSPIQAIDGCYALAIKPDNLKFTFLIFFCTFKDFLLYEFDLKGVWLSVSSSSCKLQNMISLTFFAILRVLATSNNALLVCNELQLISYLKKPTKQRVTDACLEIFFRLILHYIIMFFQLFLSVQWSQLFCFLTISSVDCRKRLKWGCLIIFDVFFLSVRTSLRITLHINYGQWSMHGTNKMATISL